MARADPRGALVGAAAARGLSLSALSTAIRRNPAYLQQWVARGSPKVLGQDDRRVLGAMLGLSDEALGGPPARDAPLRLPRLDVAASAGPGAYADEDALLGFDAIDPRLARALRLKPGRAGIIGVRGDSMAPQLLDGDRLIVDEADQAPDARGGVYVVRIEGALLVKRVRAAKAGLLVTSDNPAAGPVPDGAVEVVGRVVWRMGAPQ